MKNITEKQTSKFINSLDSEQLKMFQALTDFNYTAGMKMACTLMDSDYERTHNHKYKIGDCILAKLNRLSLHKIRKRTMGMWTGLRDCDGRNIYEGDYMQGNWKNFRKSLKLIVVWQAPEFVMKLSKKNKYWTNFNISSDRYQLYKKNRKYLQISLNL